MPKTDKTFVLKIDSREQQPLQFMKRQPISDVVVGKLETGDYSIVGLENIVTVERKGSSAELATNLFEDRFYRELERMKVIPYSFVLCTFPFWAIENFPKESTIPASKWRRLKVRGPLLLKTLTEAMLDYPYVRWVFAETDAAAKGFVRSLFKRVVERHVPN